MKKNSFIISSEGDCERVAKVFVQWLKNDDEQLKKKQYVKSPNEDWAILFSDIYADEIGNNDLASKAEDRIIQVEFSVETPDHTDLSNLSNDELMDKLQEFLEDLEDDFDIEEDNDDE